MRVLITGGSGYIGRHLAHFAISKGFEVINYDLVRPAISFHPEKDQWVQGDLLDTGLLTTCFQCDPVELVIHTALIRDLPEDAAALEKAVTLNVEGTRSLLWSMASVGSQKLVALSGARVYGFCSNPYISEEVYPEPMGKIGESLYAAEEMMLEFQEGLPGFLGLLRLFEVYGYGSAELASAFCTSGRDTWMSCLSSWKKGEATKVFGKDFTTRDGTYVRDFMHIQDVSRAVFEASRYMEQEPRLISNLGLGKGYSQVDLFKMLEETFQVEAKIDVKDRRPEEAPRLVANTEYLYAWCGSDFLPLKDSIEAMSPEASDHSDPQTAQCHPPQNNLPSEVQKT